MRRRAQGAAAGGARAASRAASSSASQAEPSLPPPRPSSPLPPLPSRTRLVDLYEAPVGDLLNQPQQRGLVVAQAWRVGRGWAIIERCGAWSEGMASRRRISAPASAVLQALVSPPPPHAHTCCRGSKAARRKPRAPPARTWRLVVAPNVVDANRPPRDGGAHQARAEALRALKAQHGRPLAARAAAECCWPRGGRRRRRVAAAAARGQIARSWGPGSCRRRLPAVCTSVLRPMRGLGACKEAWRRGSQGRRQTHAWAACRGWAGAGGVCKHC